MGYRDHTYRSRHHDPYRSYDHHHHSGHGDSFYQGHIGSAIVMRLVESVVKNKTLLIALIIACVVAVILGIVILIKLVPWVFSLFGYIQQGGVNGIVDTALRILRSVLEGAGKG